MLDLATEDVQILLRAEYHHVLQWLLIVLRLGRLQHNLRRWGCYLDLTRRLSSPSAAALNAHPEEKLPQLCAAALSHQAQLG